MSTATVEKRKPSDPLPLVDTPIGPQPPPIASFFRPIMEDELRAPVEAHSPRPEPLRPPPKGVPKLWERVIFWQLNPGIKGAASPMLADIHSFGPNQSLNLNVHEAGFLTFCTGVPYSKNPQVGCWSYTSDLKP